jgi:hypothetical protein
VLRLTLSRYAQHAKPQPITFVLKAVQSSRCNALLIALQLIRTIMLLQGGQSFKDPNILAHHLHGHYGNPGTNAEPCSPAPPAGIPCYRGDNIFVDILPGNCTEYQYDISPVNSPGTFWWVPGATSM